MQPAAAVDRSNVFCHDGRREDEDEGNHMMHPTLQCPASCRKCPSLKKPLEQNVDPLRKGPSIILVTIFIIGHLCITIPLWLAFIIEGDSDKFGHPYPDLHITTTVCSCNPKQGLLISSFWGTLYSSCNEDGMFAFRLDLSEFAVIWHELKFTTSSKTMHFFS